MIRSSEATLTGFKIRILRQSASPIDHALEEGRSVFVGSGNSCGIKVSGEDVAEIHCLVDVDDDVVSIQDWASKAGTKVNGTMIDDKTPIRVGDAIVVGSVKLELVGGPSGQSQAAKQNALDLAAKAAQEAREESVGMENLGYEDLQDDGTTVTEPTPAARPPIGRLSDALAETAAEPITEPITTHVVEEPAIDTSDSDASIVQQPETSAEHKLDEPESDEDPIVDDFAANHLTAEDLDWDPDTFDDDQVDAEIVQLLKSEIEDLRIQLAERDEQLAAMEGLGAEDGEHAASNQAGSIDQDFGGDELVGRVDDLLAELAEHDERVSMLQELLQTAEIQNQAEREERSCLENWVGEIEQRIGERESEWKAEQDALRDRLNVASQERDQFQQQLHTAAKRYGQASVGDAAPDETLQKLQKQNAELQTALEESQKQCVSLNRQIERMQNEEPESLQELRAELAQEKASVSRMRFQLSKQLQEIDGDTAIKEQPDREFAYKLQALRQHLREIHEEEKVEREQKGESLLGRISNLWKRVGDEY
ncbi:hypothetical protein CKO51_28555 [Rhodopirellula sp. SM50]|nr:FHA domain-containing protein [Rhodopirellula sp. SM50]PAY16058.1 hypothetical protein CKO51_28555 [Rhodopirellula sp. SM50]